jgi:hypothetical protein
VLDHIDKIALLRAFSDSAASALLNDNLIEPKFLGCSFEHLLLDCIFGNETEDIDLLLLTDSVRSIHSLQIGLRIPVRIVENDDVGCGKVDTETTGSSSQEEDELLRVWLLIVVDSLETVFMRGTSVDPAVVCGLQVSPWAKSNRTRALPNDLNWQ